MHFLKGRKDALFDLRFQVKSISKSIVYLLKKKMLKIVLIIYEIRSFFKGKIVFLIILGKAGNAGFFNDFPPQKLQ